MVVVVGESEGKNMSEFGVAGVGAGDSVGFGGGGAVGDGVAVAGDVGRGCGSERRSVGNNGGAAAGAEVGAEDNGGGGGGDGGGGVGEQARG